MKKSILTFAALSVILAASPALSTGFTGQDLAKAAQEAAGAINNEQVEAFNATEVFRLQMAYNPNATFDNLPETIKQKLTNALGELNNKRAYQTAWFMAGAITKAGEKANQTRLYNPLAQIWLDIDWVNNGETLQIGDVSSANSVVDDWSAKNGSYLLAFANSYWGAVQINSREVAQSNALFAIADKWIQGLADWALSPTKAFSVENAQKAILNGDCAKFGADGAIIDTLPREVRASFSPLTGFQNNSGGAVLFGTPLYPQIIIAADFDSASRPKLKNLTLLNLANTNQNTSGAR